MTQALLQPVATDTSPVPPAALRILVVDDSRLQRRLLCAPLRRFGYEVTEAESAQEALAACDVALPDMIISDWVMPGMSGIDFCRALHERDDENYCYFILVTSKSEKTDIAEGLDAGADDFLSKPVNSDELRARVTAGERIVRMQRELAEKNRLVRVTLNELQHVYDLLNKDLMDARRLQQGLVRERHKSWPEGELALMLRSAGHVGGDLVGFFPTDDGKVGLYGIDVSGHGVSSALMTARLAGNLSAAAPAHNVALRRQADGRFVAREPLDVVARLNDIVLNEMETEHYFTFLLAFVEMSSGAVSIAQAGHPHPLIQRGNGQVEQAGAGGFPVGLLEGVAFDQFSVHLEPGDRLLLLSDGVTECPDPAGNLLGENGLADMMQRFQDIRGNALLEALIFELSRFAGTEDFPDDVSGILFEYAGPDQDI